MTGLSPQLTAPAGPMPTPLTSCCLMTITKATVLPLWQPSQLPPWDSFFSFHCIFDPLLYTVEGHWSSQARLPKYFSSSTLLGLPMDVSSPAYYVITCLIKNIASCLFAMLLSACRVADGLYVAADLPHCGRLAITPVAFVYAAGLPQFC